MKIGIFTNNYLPNPYGVTGSVESFRRELETLGHQVFIFAPSWRGYQDQNPHVFRYPSVDIEIKFRFPLAIPYSRKIDKIIASLDFDIIHAQHPNLLGTAAAKWAKKKQIPLVFTWHTLYDRYTNFVPFLPRKMAASWIINKAVNYANACDQVIIPTESIQPVIQKWGVTNRNITAIATGVDEENFKNLEKNIVRKKYGIAENEILLLLVSRLTEEKNVEFLADAVRPLLKDDIRVKFLVVGGGYLMDKLQAKAAADGLVGQMIFTGEIQRNKIGNYFAAGDIFVYASKSETQGMIITEAMYAGLPIVAVRAPGISSIVEDGSNGMLVSEDEPEFQTAVAKLIDESELRKKMGAQSARLAREKYTSRISAQKMLQVYEKAIREVRP